MHYVFKRWRVHNSDAHARFDIRTRKPKISCIPIRPVPPAHTDTHTPTATPRPAEHVSRSCVMHVIADVVHLFSFITTFAVRRQRHRRDARAHQTPRDRRNVVLPSVPRRRAERSKYFHLGRCDSRTHVLIFIVDGVGTVATDAIYAFAR